jgi:hypothetical protein
MDLGSGMTGGLVYVLKDLLPKDGYNQEFVRCANADGVATPGEDRRLRRALKEHARQTGSPRAKRLLDEKGPLPILRLEPVSLPCSLAQTWSPILARWEKPAVTSAKPAEQVQLDTAEGLKQSVA